MSSKAHADRIVLDASATVEALLDGAGSSVTDYLANRSVHVPAHFDSEVLSALGRLNRAEAIKESTVTRSLDLLVTAPFERHALNDLVLSAWESRHTLRLADGLYVALARQLEAVLLTSDTSLANAADVAVHIDELD